MNDIFGVPMNSIMVALLVLLGIALASVAYVILRNRIFFLIGVRNIPRRLAQTVLIVIGLMLSTLIISAALTTGDTVDHSLTTQSYTLLGHVDEFVQQRGEQKGSPREINSFISEADVNALKASPAVAGNSEIDGFLPVLFGQVPVIDPRSRQSEPSVNVAGLDAGALSGVPDVVSTKTGKALDVASLGPDQVYMNQSAADSLDAKPGDQLQVFVGGQPHDFTVVDTVKERVLTGVGDFNHTEGLVMRLDTLQNLFGRPGEVSFIAVSNNGGVRDGLGLSSSVMRTLKAATASSSASGAGLEPYAVKEDLVHQSKLAGNFMATFFVVFGLFSIASGMLLIVMIFVMLAAERMSELGMARAVGTKRGHLIQLFMSEGMAYNLVAAAVGAALGVGVAFGMARIMAQLFSEFNISIQPYVTLRSLIIAYSLGVVLTFITVTFASWRVSNLNIVRAIRDIPEGKRGGLTWRWLLAGIACVALGGLLVMVGLRNDRAFPFALGFSLIVAGAALLLRYLRFPDRPVVTVLGIALLVLWGLTAGDRLEFAFGHLEGSVEMFFLSGLVMVTASTFVLVYNADIVLAALTRLGTVAGGIMPAVKTAVAYPLANKFRTGMTLAMISLVMFALTMMATMNFNFNKVFLADTARGGWDVLVDENPNNPIRDLSAALRSSASSLPDGFRATGNLFATGESRVASGASADASKHYPVFGVDAGFVDGGSIPLSERARGFDSDQAVWQALKSRNDVAIVDRFAVIQGGGFTFGGQENVHISGIDANAKQFDPVTITIVNPISGATARVQVIGVIDFGASASFFGVYVPEAAFRSIFGEPLLTRHYVALQNAGQAQAVAREIEATLLPTGAQAESIKHRIEHDQALTRNFFLLMQGFTGLGLFVGIAAVGVIAFRTVVERRQQIGMLRAIGYKRGLVALSFMLESSFVTLLAIASGVGLAIWLSFFLITSDQFPTSSTGYSIPWPQILITAGLAFGASLVMTYIPARQAAGIPTAEALRYE